MAGTQQIRFSGGKFIAIYSDDLADVFAALGPTKTTRASHVEPHPTQDGWVADMLPVDGPVLGVNGEFLIPRPIIDGAEVTDEIAWADVQPFPSRQLALDAEVEWLHKNRGL